MLTTLGATKTLSALAYDAKGNGVDATFTWTSSAPAVVSVDAAGKVTAASANGSSQVVVAAAGFKSAPLLVAVTAPVAGAILLTDAQITGEPFETDPTAAPSFDNTYKIVLNGVSVPNIGAILINTESKAVAGRVVAVSTVAGSTTVTLGLMSMRELFPNLNLSEVIDLSQAPLEYSADVIAAYDVQRTGNTFTFTPKPGAALGGAGTRAKAAAAPTALALPPFRDCKSSATFGADQPLPIALTAPPVFKVTISPSLDLLYTSQNGLERFVVKAEPTFAFEGGVTASVAFQASFECRMSLFAVRIPVGGPISLAVGGLLPVGIGFNVTGKITVATFSIGTKIEARSKAEIGLACPAGSNCEFVRSLGDFAVTATPTVHMPNIGTDLRVEPSLTAFGFIKAAIGNPFLTSLRFDFFEAMVGPKLEGNFAPSGVQIADTAYKSDYKLSLEASVGTSQELDGLLKMLGLPKVTALAYVISVPIAASPTGTANRPVGAAIVRASSSSLTNPAKFQAQDTLNFKIGLDPATIDFLTLYNVAEVILLRTNATTAPTRVGQVTAVDGQTNFDIAYTAPDAGDVSEFFAFVVTKILPTDLLSLEIGMALPTGADGPPSRMSAGFAHTCAVLTGGSVKCWGWNEYGQLGNGTFFAGNGTPGSEHGIASAGAALGISTATGVALSDTVSYALLADGTVMGWGEGASLGNSSAARYQATPIPVVGISTATAVSAGYDSACALLVDKTIRCWGANAHGELGDGNTSAPGTFGIAATSVIGISTARSVSVANNYSACAVVVDGTIKCWGYNWRGELGNGTTVDSSTPVSAIGVNSALAVSTNNSRTCAVLFDGTMKCWGYNANGELGNGSTTDVSVPVSVVGISNATAVSIGESHTCALLADGRVMCWGSNWAGQLGNGSFDINTPTLTPALVPGITTATAVSCGADHTCVILSDGTVKCWGYGQYGSIGDGILADHKVLAPVSVTGFP